MIEDELAAWLEYRKILEGRDDGEIYESDLSEDEILDQFERDTGGIDDGRGVGRPPAAGDEWRDLSMAELLREVEEL